MLKFSDFLVETLQPQFTTYGMNDTCDDEVIKTMNMGDTILRVTYFIHDGNKFKLLYYSDGVIAYGIQSTTDNKKWILHPSKKDGGKNIFRLYGKIIYLMKIFIDKFNIKYFEFTGSESRLDQTYSKIFSKSGFIDMMSDLGFELDTYKNEKNDTVYYGYNGKNPHE